MATPGPDSTFNLFQELLSFTDKQCKGTKKAVNRDEYVRNLRGLFKGTNFKQLTEALNQLEEKGLLTLDWLSPGDFSVSLTDAGKALFHQTSEPTAPPPPSQPALPVPPPLPPRPPVEERIPLTMTQVVDGGEPPVETRVPARKTEEEVPSEPEPEPAEPPMPTEPPLPTLTTFSSVEESAEGTPPSMDANTQATETVAPAAEKPEEAQPEPPPPLPPEPPLPMFATLPPSEENVTDGAPQSIDANTATVETVVPSEGKAEEQPPEPPPPLPEEPPLPPPPPAEENIQEPMPVTADTGTPAEEAATQPEPPAAPSENALDEPQAPDLSAPPLAPKGDMVDDGRTGIPEEQEPAYIPPSDDYSMGTPEAITEPPTDPVELEGEALIEAYLSGVSRQTDEDPRLYIDRARTTSGSGAPVYVISVIQAIEDDLAEAYCRVPKDRMDNLARVERDVAGELSKRLGTPLETDESLLDYLRRLKSMMGRPPEPEASPTPGEPAPRVDGPTPHEQ
jgi:hypothetical protein